MRKILATLLMIVLPLSSIGQTVIHPLDNMPLVLDNRFGTTGAAPEEKRGENVRYYLQASVRVVNATNSGSATICYYDNDKGIAYLISCGHLFPGSGKPGKSQKTCEVEVYYKNNIKLSKPQLFPATVICWDNDEDISFLSFKPDWQIEEYFPIAPVSFPIKMGDIYESTGCDHAKEVASYTVEISDGVSTGPNLISKNNSPRPGRSGGALLSRDGYYLGIVWGTSDYNGSGVGYYVPLRRIHAYAVKYPEISWLLKIEQSNFLAQIHIVSLDKQIQFPKGFIPKS